MSDTRRGFFKFLGLGGAAVALPATVKNAVELPDSNPESFAGGTLRRESDLFSRFASPCLDVQDGVLYDRVFLPPGMLVPRSLSFFTVPIGQPGRVPELAAVATKDLSRTNMRYAAMLPAPNEFLAHRILFAVHPSAAQRDLDLLSANSYWELYLLNKVMLSGPVLLNPPAREELSAIVKPHSGEIQVVSNPPQDELPPGVLASAHHNRITGGLFIPPLCYFRLEVMTNSQDVTLSSAAEGGCGVDLLIALQGAEGRAVQ